MRDAESAEGSSSATVPSNRAAIASTSTGIFWPTASEPANDSGTGASKRRWPGSSINTSPRPGKPRSPVSASLRVTVPEKGARTVAWAKVLSISFRLAAAMRWAASAWSTSAWAVARLCSNCR